MKIIALLGAPGSGKGTQAKKLSQSGICFHLSTGDTLRGAIKDGTEIGLRAKTLMDRGELVPDSVMIEMVECCLGTLPDSMSVLLDGFPRTVPQAKALDLRLRTTVHLAVYFKMHEQDLVLRLTGRQTCERCGEPYHISFVPPLKQDLCDRCGGNLIQRSDDMEAVVRQRLRVFATQNEALLSYYEKTKRLIEVDAGLPVATLQSNLQRMLSEWLT